MTYRSDQDFRKSSVSGKSVRVGGAGGTKIGPAV
jgi:hypothetical protein